MITQVEATIEDLYYIPEHGKAELVNGAIVTMPACGFLPNRGASKIFMRLFQHEAFVPSGYACSDNIGFIVDLPNRKSFSPDASFFVGPTTGMKFLNGTPIFAVEVRSEHDYGPTAEREMAAKRRDYFAAGTLVVWDVDLQSDDVIRAYDQNHPDPPVIYRRGDTARATLALPGWEFPVDELFF